MTIELWHNGKQIGTAELRKEGPLPDIVVAPDELNRIAVYIHDQAEHSNVYHLASVGLAQQFDIFDG